MKNYIIFYSVVAAIYGIWVVILQHLYPERIVQNLLYSICGTLATLLLIVIIMGISWRVQNGVDVWATLISDENLVKEKMLIAMRYRTTQEAMDELSVYFRNYPQWPLEEWEVFRAWYKYTIDKALKFPQYPHLRWDRMDETYTTKFDGYYDPEAPDWELYADPSKYDVLEDKASDGCEPDYPVEEYDDYDSDDYDDEENYDDDDDNDYEDDYDDEDDDDDDDEYDDADDDEDEDYDDDETNYRSRRKRRLRKAAEEGFYTGIGLGAGLSLGDPPTL